MMGYTFKSILSKVQVRTLMSALTERLSGAIGMTAVNWEAHGRVESTFGITYAAHLECSGFNRGLCFCVDRYPQS